METMIALATPAVAVASAISPPLLSSLPSSVVSISSSLCRKDIVDKHGGRHGNAGNHSSSTATNHHDLPKEIQFPSSSASSLEGGSNSNSNSKQKMTMLKKKFDFDDNLMILRNISLNSSTSPSPTTTVTVTAAATTRNNKKKKNSDDAIVTAPITLERKATSTPTKKEPAAFHQTTPNTQRRLRGILKASSYAKLKNHGTPDRRASAAATGTTDTLLPPHKERPATTSEDDGHHNEPCLVDTASLPSLTMTATTTTEDSTSSYHSGESHSTMNTSLSSHSSSSSTSVSTTDEETTPSKDNNRTTVSTTRSPANTNFFGAIRTRLSFSSKQNSSARRTKSTAQSSNHKESSRHLPPGSSTPASTPLPVSSKDTNITLTTTTSANVEDPKPVGSDDQELSSTTTTTSASTITTEEVLLDDPERDDYLRSIQALHEQLLLAHDTKRMERTNFRKKDAMMVRFARGLKQTIRDTNIHHMNLVHLEESIAKIEHGYMLTKQELQDTKHRRVAIENALQIETQQRRAQEQTRQRESLEQQQAFFDDVNKHHQDQCYKLCREILRVNASLQQWKATLHDVHNDDAKTTKHSSNPVLFRRNSRSHTPRPRPSGRHLLLQTVLVGVAVGLTFVLAILASMTMLGMPIPVQARVLGTVVRATVEALTTSITNTRMMLLSQPATARLRLHILLSPNKV